MNNSKVLLLVFTLLLPGIAGAQSSVSTKGLTDEQKAQLALQAAQMNAQNEQEQSTILPSTLDPKELNEWVDLGKNIGLAVAATAKELGVASDTFLESTTGKITVVLIVWKVMGEDIIGVFGGTAAWFTITSIILWSFKFFHMSQRSEGVRVELWILVAHPSGLVLEPVFPPAENYDGKTVLLIGHAATRYGLEHHINGVSLTDLVSQESQFSAKYILS